MAVNDPGDITLRELYERVFSTRAQLEIDLYQSRESLTAITNWIDQGLNNRLLMEKMTRCLEGHDKIYKELITMLHDKLADEHGESGEEWKQS